MHAPTNSFRNITCTVSLLDSPDCALNFDVVTTWGMPLIGIVKVILIAVLDYLIGSYSNTGSIGSDFSSLPTENIRTLRRQFMDYIGS